MRTLASQMPFGGVAQLIGRLIGLVSEAHLVSKSLQNLRGEEGWRQQVLLKWLC